MVMLACRVLTLHVMLHLVDALYSLPYMDHLCSAAEFKYCHGEPSSLTCSIQYEESPHFYEPDRTPEHLIPDLLSTASLIFHWLTRGRSYVTCGCCRTCGTSHHHRVPSIPSSTSIFKHHNLLTHVDKSFSITF